MGCSSSKVAENIMDGSSEVGKDKNLPSEVKENELNSCSEDFSILASETPCKWAFLTYFNKFYRITYENRLWLIWKLFHFILSFVIEITYT